MVDLSGFRDYPVFLAYLAERISTEFHPPHLVPSPVITSPSRAAAIFVLTSLRFSLYCFQVFFSRSSRHGIIPFRNTPRAPTPRMLGRAPLVPPSMDEPYRSFNTKRKSPAGEAFPAELHPQGGIAPRYH
jgi:hypothetical protein